MHIAFDEATAVLVGDALLTEGFAQLLHARVHSDRKVAMVACLSERAGHNGMVGGQVADIGGQPQDEEALSRILAGFPLDKLHIATFDTMGTVLRPKASSRKAVQHMLDPIKAGGGTMHSSAVQAIYNAGMRVPADAKLVVIVVGDEAGERGETLSGIAEHYLSNGVSLNQMMMALFQANPQAFSDNINVLHEGAVLRLPAGDALLRQAPETATANVVRQTDAWRDSGPQQARLAEVPGPESYGPVSSGETLSGIAERVLSDGVSMNQMMMALFEANPQAFSGNINVLYEGAVLRVPAGDELLRQVPEAATAEVVRQTDAWRAGSRQQARLTTAPADEVTKALMYEGPPVRVAALEAEPAS